MTECGIALGSNTGDRLTHLRAAAAALKAQDAAAEFSPVYETAPVDCPGGSGAFYNAVAVIRWAGTPQALLTFLREIEGARGRAEIRARNAPRPMDLDILYAGGTVLEGGELILPHPRLHLRRFVLQPLADLRPAMVLPGFAVTVSQLLKELATDEPPPERLPLDWSAGL